MQGIHKNFIKNLLLLNWRKMKKTYLVFITAITCFISVQSNAQTWNASSVSTTTTNDCIVGGNLSVGGGFIDMTKSGDPDFRAIKAYSNNFGLAFMSNKETTDGSGIELYGPSSARKGRIYYYSLGSGDIGHLFLSCTDPGASPSPVYKANMGIFNDGKVVVGDDIIYSPSLFSSFPDYSFFVNKGIFAGGNLTVNGGLIDMPVPSDDGVWRTIRASTTEAGLGIMANTGTTNGCGIELNGTSSSRPGAILYFSNGDAVYGHVFLNYNTKTSYSALMGITNDGRVVIGQDIIYGSSSARPAGYNLYVSKGILTEKLKVANSTDAANWSDFVFDKNYKLQSLSSVEEFINKHKHLPEIPSAKEVAANGIDIAEMDAKLLQKIEELTLYVIQQQKEINELKNK